jgi:restriction endonuclease Mrr
VSIPSYQELMLPILRLTADGNATIGQCAPFIVKMFGMKDEDATALLPS